MMPTIAKPEYWDQAVEAVRSELRGLTEGELRKLCEANLSGQILERYRRVGLVRSVLITLAGRLAMERLKGQRTLPRSARPATATNRAAPAHLRLFDPGEAAPRFQTCPACTATAEHHYREETKSFFCCECRFQFEV